MQGRRNGTLLALFSLLPTASGWEVSSILASACACAALLDDGRSITWHHSCAEKSAFQFLAQRGADADDWPGPDVAAAISAGVAKIVASDYHFAALKSDGSVVTWASRTCTACQDAPMADLVSDVADISAGTGAVAALKRNGTILAWGKRCCGGDFPEQHASASPAKAISLQALRGGGFVARMADGGDITWGHTKRWAGEVREMTGSQSTTGAAQRLRGLASLWDPTCARLFAGTGLPGGRALQEITTSTISTTATSTTSSFTVSSSTASTMTSSSSTMTITTSTDTTSTDTTSTDTTSTDTTSTGTTSTDTTSTGTTSMSTTSTATTTSSSMTTSSTSSSLTHTTTTSTSTTATVTTSTRTTSTRTFTSITQTTSTATTVTITTSTATTVTTTSSTGTTTSFTSSSTSSTSVTTSSTTTTSSTSSSTTKTFTTSTSSSATSTSSTTTSITTSSTTKTVTTSTSSSATSTSSTTTSVTTSSTTKTVTTSTSSSATSTSSTSTTSTFSSSSITHTTSTSSSATSTSSSTTSQTTSSTTETHTTSTSSSATSTSSTTTSSTTSSTTETKTTSTSSSATSSSTSSSSTSTTSTSATSSSTSFTSTSSTVTTVTSSSSTSTSSTTSTTTTTSSSSTTTTTTLIEAVVLPSTLQNTTQGEVLFQSLEAALSLTAMNESMLVADTETGRVTAVKLAPAENETSTVLTLERTSGSGTMSVVVPQDLLQNLSTGGNTIMVMTEVTEEVTRGIPTGAETGDKVVLHSPVVDFSFVNEVSGTLRLVEVNGSVPIGFTITNRPPVPGERCSYFDPVLDAWSDAGMELVNGSYIDGADGANVSWCVTTHTSMFALIQSLPLDLLHESDDNSLNVSGYMAAIGVTLGMVFILCVMCSPWLRRVRAPTSGHVRLVSRDGQVRHVGFECSLRERDKEDGVQSAPSLPKSASGISSTSQKLGLSKKDKPKVVVKWDVTEEMLEDVADQHYSRKAVKTNLSWSEKRQVMKTKTSESIESRRSEDRKMTLRRLAESKSQFELKEDGDSGDEDGQDPRESEFFYEDFDLDEDDPPITVDLDAWFKLDRIEAYKDGEAVMYFSASQRAFIPAKIVGHGLYENDTDLLPNYDLIVGVRKQRRTMVPLCALRRPLLAGDHVQAFFAKSTKRSSQMQASEREESEGPSAASTARKGEWVNALVLQPPAIHLSAHATTFHILLEEEREPGRGRRYDMMLSQLQRRYLQGDQVEVFRGREGWAQGVVAEDVVEEIPTLPEDLQIGGPPLPEEDAEREKQPETAEAVADDLSPLKREGSMVSMASMADTKLFSVEAALAEQSTMVSVYLDGSREAVKIPSFQLLAASLPSCSV